MAGTELCQPFLVYVNQPINVEEWRMSVEMRRQEKNVAMPEFSDGRWDFRRIRICV